MSDSKTSGRAVSLLVLFLPLALTGQRAPENAVPLKNWATPLYWQPNQAERGTPAPQLVFSANAVSADALTFVAITPCRLVDTRGAAAGFNGMDPFAGPSIAAKATLTIPVQSPTEATTNTTPAPCGVIPSIAQAYSFNLTVVPVAGGAVDYVSLWPAGGTQPFVATLNDPQGALVANAAIVPAGPATNPGYGGISVYNDGPATTNVVIDMNGYFTAPTDGLYNTAIGAGTLASNTTGSGNTAAGGGALYSNTTGSGNTASGGGALTSNTTGSFNTASGDGALNSNTTGTDNTASGVSALQYNTTGGNNTASGAGAMQGNTSGGDNTASGADALQYNTTGSYNTASGADALQYNTTGSNNTASGYEAMQRGSTGNNNTADGYQALLFNSGNNNTASGYAALTSNNTGSNNTASGYAALTGNTTGSNNTASGYAALTGNTTGSNNTASGVNALAANTNGAENTAGGTNALIANTAGVNNSASGYQALQANTTGNYNTAGGAQALFNTTTGGANTAFGYDAGFANATGSGNIAVGNAAATGVPTGSSNNIHIGNQGAATDAGGVIKIGSPGVQTSFYVAGVSGVKTGLSGAVSVLIDSDGQLGTSSSSRRFKEDIQDMGEASSGLMRLRPVTFRYRQAYSDGSKPVDYGLIAEEVAEVYPDLVAHSTDGQIETVQYQKVNAMLLNEVQKQHQQIQQQQEEMSAVKARLSELERQLERLAAPR